MEGLIKAETGQGWLCGVNYTPVLRNRMVMYPPLPGKNKVRHLPEKFTPLLKPRAKRKTVHSENVLLPQTRVRMW